MGCYVIRSAVYMRRHIQSEQLCDMCKRDEYIMHSSSSMATFQHQPNQQYLCGMC